MSNYDTGAFWIQLKHMSPDDIEGYINPKNELWDETQRDIAQVYVTALKGGPRAADRIAELESQRDALVELARKGSRGAGLGLRLPIEGEIEKILQGDLAGDRNIEVPSGQLETSTESPDVRVTSDGPRVPSVEGHGSGFLTDPSDPGRRIAAPEHLQPTRDALATILDALNGTVPNDFEGLTNLEKNPFSTPEHTTLVALISASIAMTTPDVWADSTVDVLSETEEKAKKGYKLLTETKAATETIQWLMRCFEALLEALKYLF